MAKSHADVAKLFAQCKVARGSRMASVIHDSLIGKSGSLFTRRVVGISYNTRIAQIVVNHHTQKSELWVTPSRYSMSTNRHENYYTSAFIEAYVKNHGCTHDEARAQVFMTRAVDDHTARHNPYHAQMVLDRLPEWLQDADKPRLRSATRYGSLQQAKVRLDRALDRMTRGIPLDCVDAPTLYALQDALSFLNNTLAIADVDEMRTVVRGYLALSKD